MPVNFQTITKYYFIRWLTSAEAGEVTPAQSYSSTACVI